MNIRTLGLGLLVAACGTLPLSAQSSAGDGAASAGSHNQLAQSTRTQFQATHPQTALHETGAQVSRIYGAAFGGGADPVAAAETFRQQYASLFGVAAEELTPVSRLPDGRQTQPLMYDPQTDTYKFTLVYYSQVRGGLPVFRSELRLLVRNEPNYPLVLAASTLRDIGDFAADPVLANLEFDPAVGADTGMTRFWQVEKVIWAGAEDELAEPVLAVTFIGENDRTDAGYECWRFVCEAATGKILYRETMIHFTDVNGYVKAMATPGAKANICTAEILFTYPWAKVEIVGGTSVFANGSGNFTIPNAGTSAVTVRSYVDGKWFTIQNQAGSVETLTATITPPGPANFTHNQANTDDQILAQTNIYTAGNACRDWVLTQNPSFPGVPTDLGVLTVVNRNDGYCPCNAWSSSSDGSINFCLPGSGCPNTAWQSVLNHEYGHHVIDFTGSGQGEYGEGIADCFSILPVDDPHLGYGFFGDCNASLRNADNTCQYLVSGCSTCGSEIHDCGNLLSGIVWSIRNQLHTTHPTDYLSILSHIVVDSILVHTGTGINPQLAIDFLTMDDNDGNIGNGTPHRMEICAGFSAHGISCPALEVGLSVSPATNLISSGPLGGPFTPSSINYSVWNLGPTSTINYNVTKTASWLTVTNPTGSLNIGQTATVTVSINSNADLLPAGDYSDSVQFINTTDHVGDTARTVTLRAGYNDLCVNAKTACPGNTYAGTTVGATVDGTATCGTSSTTPDVWYKYVPATSGSATFSLCGSGTTYDSVLSVHTGTCPGTAQIGCDDDGCGGSGAPSTVTASVTAGTVYLIRVSGWSNHTGAYSLTITGPACGDLPPTLSVTPSEGLSSSGNAGGPFTPATKDYTVRNLGGASLDYTVAKTQGWVTLSGTGGSLAAGASTTVTVSINSNANSLGNGTYNDTVTFTNTTNHVGDTARPVTLQIGVPGVVYNWNLDTNPGWTISGGLWAYGQPAGLSGDPSSGHTGTNVYGYNLSGDYTNSMPEYYLTTTPINCTTVTGAIVKFWRWLGVEDARYDHAKFQVSNNGTTWTTLYENPIGSGPTRTNVNESAWTQQSYDISAVADSQATVYLRWVMGTTDGTTVFHGWNIDDVLIWGLDSRPPDTTPPAPDPMTFAVPPAPASTTSITMTATTATDASSPPVSYFFDFVSGGAGGTDSAWQVGTSYTDAGLSVNTSYTYRVKARDNAATPRENAYSDNFSTATFIQTPTGVSFGTVTADSIVLNANGFLSNLTTGSSGLFFDSTTAGGDVGINAWVTATSDTATSLGPDTSYTFLVKARNQNAVETVYSPTASKVTLANVPGAPALGSPAAATMTLDVDPNGNPAGTVFAIQCPAVSPNDPAWLNQYVSAAGTASATAVWQTDAAWGVITIIGLQPETTYRFAVKARNQDGVETGFGPEASLATSGVQTGACCYDVAPCAMLTSAACTAGGGTYKDDGTTCTLHLCCVVLGDLTGDGVVSGADIQGFVNAMLAGFAPCADLATPYDTLDMADVAAFVDLLLLGS